MGENILFPLSHHASQFHNNNQSCVTIKYMKPCQDLITSLKGECVSTWDGCWGNEASLKTSGIPNTVWLKLSYENSKGTFCASIQNLLCHRWKLAGYYDFYVLVLWLLFAQKCTKCSFKIWCEQKKNQRGEKVQTGSILLYFKIKVFKLCWEAGLRGSYISRLITINM